MESLLSLLDHKKKLELQMAALDRQLANHPNGKSYSVGYLDREQIANFVYWVAESTNHRNADSFSGKLRVAFIKDNLIGRFLEKYPNGKLTGWTEDITYTEDEEQ